jgi:hypothetical protein
MKVTILCPVCKEKGRRTTIEVTPKGPLNEFDDGWCHVCLQPLSGRVFPDVLESEAEHPKKPDPKVGVYHTTDVRGI